MLGNKTDKELIELAAKAIGCPVEWEYIEASNDCDAGTYSAVDGFYWNPLGVNGDAFRLQVRLNITVMNETTSKAGGSSGTQWTVGGNEVTFGVPHNGDPEAATRRAIVYAAADIGSHME